MTDYPPGSSITEGGIYVMGDNLFRDTGRPPRAAFTLHAGRVSMLIFGRSVGLNWPAGRTFETTVHQNPHINLIKASLAC